MFSKKKQVKKDEDQVNPENPVNPESLGEKEHGESSDRESPSSEIEKLKKQVEENLAGWQRARADYDNLKKDTAKEKSEFARFASANLLMELLPIMDNFNAAFNMIPPAEEKNAWVIGLGHIKKQLGDFLQSNGIEKIKTVGEKFDPELHEAVSKEKNEKEKEDVILKEVKAGYKLHGKVVQAAKVVVNDK